MTDQKMTVDMKPGQQTAEEQEQDRRSEGLSQAKLDQLSKAREKAREARLSRQDPQTGSEENEQVPKPTGGTKVPKYGNKPNEQGIDFSEKITVEQFRGMAASSPDVNALFHKFLKKLENPRAVMIEMRRLGHFVTYEYEE